MIPTSLWWGVGGRLHLLVPTQGPSPLRWPPVIPGDLLTALVWFKARGVLFPHLSLVGYHPTAVPKDWSHCMVVVPGRNRCISGTCALLPIPSIWPADRSWRSSTSVLPDSAMAL
jgi:hypothetical protein